MTYDNLTVTKEQLNKDGYFKIFEDGGSYVTADYYNPETNDLKHFTTRDYDYSDCSRDNDSLYYDVINEEVKRVYIHKHGGILIGDKIKVVKGRKVPIGTIATVIDKKPYRDKYNRIQCYYVYLDNGMRTNIDNCILAE